MKRIFASFLLFLSIVLPSQAVLTGKDLNETVMMLNSELKIFNTQLDSVSLLFDREHNRYIRQLDQLTRDFESVSLMFYSQQETFVFGQAYSAEKAEDVIHRFDAMQGYSTRWLEQYDVNYGRCRRLLATLQEIQSTRLSAEGARVRQESMTTLNQVLSSLDHWEEAIQSDTLRLAAFRGRVNVLRKDVETSYRLLHHRVFLSRDIPYHQVLSDFSHQSSRFWQGLYAMFSPSVYAYDYQKEWGRSGNIILLVFFITFLLGALLGRLVIVRHFRRKSAVIAASANAIVLLIGWSLSTLGMAVLLFFVLDNAFYHSSVKLFIELGVFSLVILCSILFRVPAHLSRVTLRGYTPVFLIAALTIGYRITLVDVILLRITLVPMLLLCALMQWYYNRKHRELLRFDRIICHISFFIFVISCVVAWVGYYFLATQIVVFWTIFLFGHLLLSCLYGIIRGHEQNCLSLQPDYQHSISFVTIHWLVYPSLLILVLGFCLFECAHVFNINEWFLRVFNHYFIDFPGKVRVSITRIFILVCLAILVNYLIHVVRCLFRNFYGEKAQVGGVGMVANVIAILLWGFYLLLVLSLIEVSSVGVIAVLSGITVGVGIALRDTLDCFFCGLSLMMGRLHIGDMVECEGVRGTVRDIRYRTTQIVTEEGAVISFFNTAFFGKNYRNLNALGEYQREHLYFKLQKDADLAHCRALLERALVERVPELATTPAPRILFSSTDRFYMVLYAEVWVPVKNYYYTRAKVLEVIFLVLKENGYSNMMEDKRTIRLEDANPTAE